MLVSIRRFSSTIGSTIVFLILGVLAPLPASTQSQSARDASSPSATPTTPAAGKLTFDVASVRPGQKFVGIGWDFLDPVNKVAPPKGGLMRWNAPVGNMIAFAYDLRNPQLKSGMWKQLPQWAQDEWYTVEARADGDPSREDVRQMVRALLEERFKFAGHAGMREAEVDALTVAKAGMLKPHAEGAPCDIEVPPAANPYPPYKQLPVRCGVFDRELSRYKRRLEMVDVTIQQIADPVSMQAPLPVVDATGLTGHYDAVLDYGPGVPPDVDTTDQDIGVPVSEALEKQLGLKLVKQTGTIQTFVVDRIEKPSEN